MKLLQIDSSARTSSVSRKLTAEFAKEWKRAHPSGEVITRDLPATKLPAITDDWSATYLDPSTLNSAQQSYLSTSDQLIDELQSADTIVIGAPMYNFSIPASLKAWIDQIVRMGKTFQYGPDGIKGLMRDKQVVVITSRGGSYQTGTPTESFDFQTPYLRHILGFIGVSNITFIHADNQTKPEASAAWSAAVEQITDTITGDSSQLTASLN